MKILHLIDSAGFYGAEAMIIELSLEQMKLELLPVICAITKPGQEEPVLLLKAKKLGLQTVALPLYGNIFLQGKSIIEYAKLNSVRVIHSHGYRPGILLGLQSFFRKIGEIRTLHGWTHTSAFSKIFVYNLVDSLLLWRQDAVVIVSERMKSNFLLRFTPKAMVSTIGNGISLKQQKYMEITDLEDETFKYFKNNYFIIGSIGRLSREKSQSDILMAASILRKNGYQVAVVIIGEGPERHSLLRLAAKLNISKYVYLPGYLDNAARFINLFDILCMSSITEGLPITILEAMRQNVPIVSTDVGDIKDLLAEGRGGLVPPKDVDALVTTIQEIINSTDKTKIMVELARNYFTANHSSEVMAKKYFNLYRTVINKRDCSNV